MRLGIALAVVLSGGCDWVFRIDRLPEIEVPPIDAPPIARQWISITSGQYHTCAIAMDQTLWCWGRNDKGQLGDGSGIAGHPYATQVVGLPPVVSIGIGAFTNCGVWVSDSRASRAAPHASNELSERARSTTASA